jgi:ubiquinone/menaquinone biosynthesis C-methylase UbiE
MTDPLAAERGRWARESVGWGRTAPETVATDDAQNQTLIGAAGIEPGMRVLDLASGAGDPAISIALRVGVDGFVAATDFSPEMLAVARRRASALGLDHVAFAVADMARLPFTGQSFDAVTCRCGVMFPDDRIAVATEARRVLTPGGRVAYLVWGPQ